MVMKVLINKEALKMKRVLSVGDAQASPGEIAKGTLGAVELADGSKATIPLIIINGTDNGPILTVIAGVHGTEISGIGALLGVVQSVEPCVLKGALLAIPGANPLAYRVGQHITPIDKMNLSGPWYPPSEGMEKASITARMANYINYALEKADYVIDMHANPLPSMPFVLTSVGLCPNEAVEKGVRKISEAYGVTVIDWPTQTATTIRNICVQRGKPSITPELSGNIFLWDEITSIGTRGIKNVMKAIGMLAGDPEPQPVDVLKGNFKLYGWLYAQRGGFMVVKKKPGEKIKKGDTAVEIVNVYGDVIQEVKMPINGYCWAFTGGVGGIHAVSEGTKLAYVFAEAKEIEGQKTGSLSDM